MSGDDVPGSYGSMENDKEGIMNNGDVDQPSEVREPQEMSLAEDIELNQIYEKIGVGRAQYIYWTTSFLIAYSDYAELSLIAIIIPYLRCEWDLTEHFEAFITISIYLIYAISALICGKLSDMFGRKRIMSITTFILLISAIGAALATNKWLFLLARSIAGACIGANFATIVVYSTEFSPSSHRMIGPLVSIMGSYSSMLLINVMGYLFLNSIGWRWLVIIITIPTVPAFILLLIMPESPRYLCVSGKMKEAEKAVRRIADINNKELPENMKIFCAQSEELGSFSVIYKSETLRRPCILLAIQYFSNILIETGILVFLPLAFSSAYCGSDHGQIPARSRCQPISQQDLWMLSGSAFGSLIGCMGAYFVAVKIGRLSPLRVGNLVQLPTFILMFFCMSAWYLFSVATAIKVFNAFICMMIWIIVPESFPTMIRNTATGFVNSSGKFGAVTGTALVYLLFYRSPTAVVCCFLLASLVSTVSSFLLKKDTSHVMLTETVE